MRAQLETRWDVRQPCLREKSETQQNEIKISNMYGLVCEKWRNNYHNWRAESSASNLLASILQTMGNDKRQNKETALCKHVTTALLGRLRSWMTMKCRSDTAFFHSIDNETLYYTTEIFMGNIFNLCRIRL